MASGPTPPRTPPPWNTSNLILSSCLPQLLEAIKPLKRGLAASEDDKQRIDRLARQLERRNPTKKPLASGGCGCGGAGVVQVGCKDAGEWAD